MLLKRSSRGVARGTGVLAPRARTLTAACAALVLATVGLAGCGEDNSTYCNAVADAGKSKALHETDYSSPTAVDQATEQIDSVLQVAPSDIRPAWQAIRDGILASQTAMRAARSAQSTAATSAIEQSVQQIQRMNRAQNAVGKDVRNRCGTTFDMS